MTPRSFPSLAPCCLTVLALAAVLVTAHPVTARPRSPNGSDTGEETGAGKGAVRVQMETIAVDGRGTWSVGHDEADLLTGTTGVLRKSVTLVGRQATDAPREMVEMVARVTPAVRRDDACGLQIDSETRSVQAATGGQGRPIPPDHRKASVVLSGGEERLLEIYASPVTEARLALRIRCAPPAGAASPDAPLIDVTLTMSRGEGSTTTLEPLKANLMRAAVGRKASNLFSFNVPLTPGPGEKKRYRREQIEVTLSPLLLSGDRVQVEFRVAGDITTVMAGVPDRGHPVERVETLILKTDEPHTVELVVDSSGAAEGWARVRYDIEIVCHF
jgi:hypothetical protein